MQTYIEAVNPISGSDIHGLPPAPRIFLAGGITSCPDWQRELTMQLQEGLSTPSLNHVVLNPRRKDFPIDDPTASQVQIEWEFKALHCANIIVFWFARGSLNPIVLFEYGSHLSRLAFGRRLGYRDRLDNIVVGCDPEYTRTQDVVIQTRLALPDLTVQQTFKDFSDAAVQAVKKWWKGN